MIIFSQFSLKNLTLFFRQQLVIIQIILLVGNLSQAQIPCIKWQKTFGGYTSDIGLSLQKTFDGGYIVAGVGSSDDGDFFGAKGSDMFVSKLDSNGNVQWKRLVGSPGQDWGGFVRQLKNGTYILSGEMFPGGDNTTGKFGLWVCGLDANGNIIWQTSLASYSLKSWSGMTSCDDGGFVLAGGVNSNLIPGGHGSDDVCLVKFDALGNIQWTKNYGGSQAEVASNIISTKDGGYFILGKTQSDDQDVSSNPTRNSNWLIKTNGLGVIEWERAYDISAFGFLGDVKQTMDGGYVLTGEIDSSLTGISNGIADISIIKLDATGKFEWRKRYGGPAYDEARAIDQTPDGGYIIGGGTLKGGGDVTNFKGGLSDWWILKLDKNGNLEWQKTYGGPGEGAETPLEISDGEFITQIIAEKNGYTVFGWADSYTGDISGNHGTSDMWLLRLYYQPPPTAVIAPGNCLSAGSISFTSPLDTFFSYRIDSGSYQSNANFLGVAAGVHSFSVKNDVTNCITSSLLTMVDLASVLPMPVVNVVQHPGCTNATGSLEIVSPKGTNFEYSVGGAYQTNTNFTGLLPGSYQVIVKDTSTGCTSQPATITLNSGTQIPAPAITITQLPDCKGNAGVLTITSPVGAAIAYSVGNVYQSNPVFKNLNAGNYNVTVKDTLTGCISAAIPVVINPPAKPAMPQVNHITQPTCIRNYGTVEIAVLAGLPLQYSLDGVYQSNGMFDNLSPGTYQLTAKDTVSGCVSLPEVIEIKPVLIPVSPVVTVTQPTCILNTGSVAITTPSGTGLEYSIGGSFQQLNIFQNVLPGNYQVVVKDISNGCISSASNIQVKLPLPLSLPVASVMSDASCTQNTGSIKVDLPVGNNYEYSVGGSFQQANIFKNLPVGIYGIKVRDVSTGCVSSPAILQIKKADPPAPPTAIVMQQPSCTILTGTIKVNSPAGNHFQFSTGGSFQPGNVITGLQPGKYNIIAKDVLTGCISTASTIDISGITTPCNDLYFPNAFTPNGDGQNDYFRALGDFIQVKNYELNIYNRYGERVFTCTEPLQFWNGVYKSIPQPANSYVWYASYTYRGKSRSQKGTVMLIR